ncbi:MAG TPA: hypothetical protein PLW93_01665 [Candidatus Absconditabacterales bacterium]|nr:hypothetical protein [Candidatus Absconditabacterales bacterium]HNG96958.1 hypothetical protein [Candidatus Absconditabacterales bacterium]
MYNSYQTTPSKSSFQRGVMLIIVVVLGFLLFVKFTGRQDIFSYQGVKTQTPGFQRYRSGVQTINQRLTQGGQGTGLLDQGKKLFDIAKHRIVDKQLSQTLDIQLDKLKELDLITTTTTCIDTLLTGYELIQSTKHEYSSMMDSYQILKSTLAKRVKDLPDSQTKTCLITYMQGLTQAIEGLTMTSRNIDQLGSRYHVLLTSYEPGTGSCSSFDGLIDHIGRLHQTMMRVHDTIKTVQGRLDSYSVSEYNTLCTYGSVHGLTGLQAQSRSVVQFMKQGEVGLKKVDNVLEYLNQLKQRLQTH